MIRLLTSRLVPAGWKQRVFYTNPELLQYLTNRYLADPNEEIARKFTSIVSTVRVGGTYKLTGWNRLDETNAMVARNCKEFDQVNLLDVGASDGIVTLQLVDQLSSELSVCVNATMFDLYTQITRCGPRWFCEYRSESGSPILFRLGPLITKIDDHKSGNRIRTFGVNTYRRARVFFKGIFGTNSENISLVSPKVHKSDRVAFTTHSVLDSNPNWHSKFNVVRASNILNRSYFSDEQLQIAIGNLVDCLMPDGILVVSRNHEECNGAPDNGSVWRKTGHRTLLRIDDNRDGSYLKNHIDQWFR